MAKFEMLEVKDASGVQLKELMKVDGWTINTFMKPPEVTAEIIHNMVNLPIRDDDVMFCSAAKSGTHWGFEVISMLVNGKAETIPIPKVFTMLEVAPQSELEKLSSPRVLNSHFPLCILPKQIKEKKIKIVVALRNLKDMAVSLYHHHKGLNLHDYNGKFADHFQLFIEGKRKSCVRALNPAPLDQHGTALIQRHDVMLIQRCVLSRKWSSELL